MPSNPDNYRPILSYTLRIKSRNSIFFSSTYHTRSKLWMTNTKNTRQRRINILSILIPSYRSINILRIILNNRNMKHWSCSIYSYHSNSIYRIRPTMRANKILGSNSNYQSIFSNSILRYITSRMNLRRICSRQCYTQSIFRTSLYITFCSNSSSSSTYSISPPNWIK